MDFRRQRPSPQAMRWVEQVLGDHAKVVAWRRMTGGTTSTVHRLTVARNGQRCLLVLRQFEHAAADQAGLVQREAMILRAVHARDLAAPELVAFSADGADTGGHPSILMTRLPGHIDLTPRDPGDWLSRIAGRAASIHDARVAAPAFQSWINAASLAPPASSARPRLWQDVIAVLRQPASPSDHCFIHHDFQHFNFLWTRGRLSGVVDWGMASTGPPGIDIGHCRLNLAVLFGAGWAERFRLAYEAETGRAVDPWWDLHAIVSYGDDWPRFIPVQVAGRAPVDTNGMTARVEELLETTLRRL